MNDSVKMFLIALVTAVAVQLVATPYVLRMHGFAPASSGPAVSGPVERGNGSVGANPQQLTAPNLEGMLVEAARDRFRDKGIVIIEDGERTDPAREPGAIIKQRPEAGEVLTNMEVRVIVAKAGESAKVPNVVGQDLDEGRAALVTAGFEVADPEFEGSDQAPGTIVSQQPNADATTKRGAVIRITVAEEPGVAVPKVKGMFYNKAKKTLEAAGLKVGAVRRVEDPERGQNYVLRQGLDPDTEVPPGTTVDLTIVAPN